MSDVAGLIERLRDRIDGTRHWRTAGPDEDMQEMEAALSSLSARIVELEREMDVLREGAVEAQVRAYKWMKAHDALQAGTAYSFPRPADVPNLVARAEAAEAKLAKAEEALSSAEAWLERWAVHVGRCAGGDRCTCGLTLVRAEVIAALSPMPNKEGEMGRTKPVRPKLFGCLGWGDKKPFLGMHQWNYSSLWNGNDRRVLPFETRTSGICRSGWRCYHCGEFRWDEQDAIFALKHAYYTGLVKIPTEPRP